MRNLWLTEKTGEVIFFENGHPKVAKWSYLRKLFDLERLGLLKLFDLTEVSIAFIPIEGQRVLICLQAFSEKTHTALLAHLSLDAEEVKNTAVFAYKVLQ